MEVQVHSIVSSRLTLAVLKVTKICLNFDHTFSFTKLKPILEKHR